MFLSRLISSTKSRYWFTKLKIADLIWVFRKIRHLIESSKTFDIVYTDHEATLTIAKQTSFTTSSIDKLNLRLIRISEYIQRFDLTIRHKSKILHVIFDALSRLSTVSNKQIQENVDEKKLDVLFTISMTKMNEKFRQQFIQEYQQNSIWRKILIILNKANKNHTDISFLRDKDIIYRKKINDNSSFVSRRMCVPEFMIKQILITIHNESNDHSDFDHIYERVNNSWYIKKLIKYLKNYIAHCSKCKVNRTRRHKFYESLQSILSSFISFHTFIIDFVLILSTSHIDMNCVMSVIDKYSKRITILVDKDVWTTDDWFVALLQKLDIADWNLLKTIISNKDKKFLSEFWIELFKRLEVKLLYSTAYHSQTDETSKRINQTFEIALRYHIQTLIDFRKWSKIIDVLQRNFNNAVTFTDKSSNEICYEFIFLQSFDLLRSIIFAKAFVLSRSKLTIQNNIAFVQMTFKQIYDRNHQLIQMKIEEWALIRLHKNYNISATAILRRKLSQQYVDFFKIIKKIENFAYRLQISNTWKVWSIFAISQLEFSHHASSDSFERTQFSSDSVFVEEDTKQIKFFEIKKLLVKKQIKRRDVEYLIRWRNYDLENDAWRNLKKLENATELVEKYESQHESTFNATIIRKRRSKKIAQHVIDESVDDSF